MQRGVLSTIAAVVGVAGAGSASAPAAVNLALRAQPTTLAPGTVVDVGVYAMAEEATEFSIVDAVLVWDDQHLRLLDVLDNGGHNWNFIFGFPDDASLDGLNDSLTDGDALFQAASFSAATATAEGLLVATLRFRALSDAADAQSAIVAERGLYSTTKVLQPGGADVTGALEGTSLAIVTEATLDALDLTIPPGRTLDLPVRGGIPGVDAFGVQVALEMVRRDGAVGEVTFTPAPPPDVEQLGDPWSGSGQFIPFDTDVASSVRRNGAAVDSGSLPVPVAFSGFLAVFPLVSAADARGTWDVWLCSGGCNPTERMDSVSTWVSLPADVLTALDHAVVRVVALFDGDGSTAVDLRDFSQLQECYTGDMGPVDPPGYNVAGNPPCSVYDRDADGDVDAVDVAAFWDALGGPG